MKTICILPAMSDLQQRKKRPYRKGDPRSIMICARVSPAVAKRLERKQKQNETKSATVARLIEEATR